VGDGMKRLRFLMLLVCAVLLTACGREEAVQTEEEELLSNEIYVYHVNADFTDVVKEKATVKLGNDVTENTADIMQDYVENQHGEEYQSPIPAGIEYVTNSFDESQGRLNVEFNIMYDEVQADSLLFFKTCVVKTLLQLEGVETVAISLTDLANNDPETATSTENFDADSFVMSFGNNNGYQQKGNIVLYFANESGEALKEYRKSIEISNNTSLATVVVEALIEGPKQEGYQATIPENTTIRNISVKDSICYIDLSDEFYNTDNSLKNDIIVYSIVNSLVELPTVAKVQFLHNGEKQSFFRETMPFDGLFERNLDLIEQEDTEEENMKVQEDVKE
jgi:germination protein M